ncbi:uncharacterized protein LOC128243138 [Mya arenaria]|uniref:uncharacterized protein LOC128243138 n=1 Tax=Mya arenaria TaxID=6604 RepID=UPI0022E6EB67|nr:uncharacterized protein LOC128243138 [Mya arenaria]
MTAVNIFFTLFFGLSLINWIICQKNEEIDLKAAKHCIQFMTKGMEGKKWLETKNKVFKLINDLPERSEFVLMAVGKKTIPLLSFTKAESDWEQSVLNMTIMSKHDGPVLGLSLENNLQDCFPDIKSPYYIPSKPEISYIFTLSSSDILGTFDNHNKKSYVILMDDGKLNVSKWLQMATNNQHILGSDSFKTLPHWLTKDTSLICDIDKYYSRDRRCEKCGEVCYGDGPNPPFCNEQGKQCSYYLQHLKDAWEMKYVTKPVEPKSLEIQTPTIGDRPTQPVPQSFNQKHTYYILAGSFGVILALITIAICCYKKYRSDQQHKRQGQHIYHPIWGEIVPELELRNTSSPQAATISDQPLVTPIQPTAPNADPTPPHTPSPTHTPYPPPGLTDNYLPNTQPVNEDMAGDEPSGSQNIELVDDDIPRLIRKAEALDGIPFCNLH